MNFIKVSDLPPGPAFLVYFLEKFYSLNCFRRWYRNIFSRFSFYDNTSIYTRYFISYDLLINESNLFQLRFFFVLDGIVLRFLANQNIDYLNKFSFVNTFLHSCHKISLSSFWASVCSISCFSALNLVVHKLYFRKPYKLKIYISCFKAQLFAFSF